MYTTQFPHSRILLLPCFPCRVNFILFYSSWLCSAATLKTVFPIAFHTWIIIIEHERETIFGKKTERQNFPCGIITFSSLTKHAKSRSFIHLPKVSNVTFTSLLCSLEYYHHRPGNVESRVNFSLNWCIAHVQSLMLFDSKFTMYHQQSFSSSSIWFLYETFITHQKCEKKKNSLGLEGRAMKTAKAGPLYRIRV